MTSTKASENNPAGAVIKTLLLSDLVDSTKMVEQLGDKRAFELFGLHDRLARDLLAEHDGLEIDKTDGFLLLFERPIDAVAYALEYHRALEGLSAELEIEVTSRVGIHLGEVYLRENTPEDIARGAKPIEVEGLAKPVAARLMSLAGPRQTLLSRGAFDLARRAAVGQNDENAEMHWLAHGAYRFKGVDEPVKVFEVGLPGLSPLTPPKDSAKVHRALENETILGWRPAPQQTVPNRANWQLERKLGEGGFGEVWLAKHKKTRDERVLKFCFDRERLKGLQREVTLFRLLKEALGNRDDIARILDWNFDEAPYFIESEFTEGGSIDDWAAKHGIEAMTMADRIEIVAQVADALSAAHSIGVLHKDLKPGNVLVWTDREDRMRARLTDFGIGMVTDHERLAEAGITALGFTETVLGDDSVATAGSQLYMAPEILEGQLPTVQADIYALGVLLYQLVVGNLRHALAPGWERDITDELLKEDIARLVDGDPSHRARDADTVAHRLRSLDERRERREVEAKAQEEAARIQKTLIRSRRRQKITVAVLIFFAIFAVAMGIQSWRVKQQADRAEREAQRAEKEAETASRVSDFLISLFEISKPEKARGETITVRELLDNGAERIETDLVDQPEVRSRLTDTLGTVYFKLGMYDTAEDLWTQTIELQKLSGETVDVGLATSLMQLAGVFLRQSRVDEAKVLLEQSLEITEAALGPDHTKVATILSNLGGVSYYQGQYRQAVDLFTRALTIYQAELGQGDPKIAKVLNNIAIGQFDLGSYPEAEDSVRAAITIWEEDPDGDPPDLARSLTCLAKILEKKGQKDEIEALYVRSLEIQEKIYGPEHPLVASTLRRLGAARLSAGDIDGAEPLLERSYTIATERLGTDHQLVAEVLIPMADLGQRRGNPALAERHLLRALKIYEASLGVNSTEIPGVLQKLALLYRDLGRDNEVRPLFERALSITVELHGAEHPSAIALQKEIENS